MHYMSNEVKIIIEHTQESKDLETQKYISDQKMHSLLRNFYFHQTIIAFWYLELILLLATPAFDSLLDALLRRKSKKGRIRERGEPILLPLHQVPFITDTL